MALLQLKKLTVRFGGLTAVGGVDCQLNEHQIVSVIGPNGAGKTTVFNAITGIYQPTSGSIEFAGRELIRPFTRQTLGAALLIGLMTALLGLLAAVNVDRLWTAAIKMNYAGPGQPFSYRAAAESAWTYLAGRLAITRAPGDRWAVVTADGRRTLAFAANAQEAESLRERLGVVVARVAFDPSRVEAIQAEEPAAAQIASRTLLEVAREGAIRRRNAWGGLLGGFALGFAGTLAVWSRSRSPDFISRSGIGRTFQNIRLFSGMTVLENVLTGVDRHSRVGTVRMALRTPAARREAVRSRERAMEWLRLVGLESRARLLARELSYGEQRRLEIARALATEPRVLLLDEPAAGMNPAESVELAELVDRLRKRGLSVLLIEHHMRVVMGISDRIAVLDYGCKIAEGTPAEVRSNPAVIKAYLGDEEVT